MRQTNLVFLVKDQEICLAMKKRGFGMGKWNGYGGKLEAGETVTSAAVREVKEEIGVELKEEDLVRVAALKFYFHEGKKDWEQELIIFITKKWHGEPTESEEMRPQWYTFEDIPFEQMWPDDKVWLPKVLAGKKLKGDFYFNDAADGFERYDLREI